MKTPILIIVFIIAAFLWIYIVNKYYNPKKKDSTKSNVSNEVLLVDDIIVKPTIKTAENREVNKLDNKPIQINVLMSDNEIDTNIFADFTINLKDYLSTNNTLILDTITSIISFNDINFDNYINIDNRVIK